MSSDMPISRPPSPESVTIRGCAGHSHVAGDRLGDGQVAVRAAIASTGVKTVGLVSPSCRSSAAQTGPAKPAETTNCRPAPTGMKRDRLADAGVPVAADRAWPEPSQPGCSACPGRRPTAGRRPACGLCHAWQAFRERVSGVPGPVRLLREVLPHDPRKAGLINSIKGA
jgi:hypothetical protein